MYLQEETMYFYLSCLFTVLPLMCSIVLVIYWIHHWHVKTRMLVPQRVEDYLKNYATALIVFTIFGTFGSAVGLVTSKIFLLKVFKFQLKEHEIERLRAWKFVNNALLEV